MFYSSFSFILKGLFILYFQDNQACTYHRNLSVVATTPISNTQCQHNASDAESKKTRVEGMYIDF